MFEEEAQIAANYVAGQVRPHYELEISEDRLFARIGGATAVIENCSEVAWVRRAMARLIIEQAQSVGEFAGQQSDFFTGPRF